MPLVQKSSAQIFKTTYSEGLVGSVKSLNPLFETNEAEKEINHIIFRGLTKIDGNGKIQPDLAESFEIRDNLDYIFYLRKDVFWTDGKPFTADDVVHTFEASQDPNLATKVRTTFKDVKVSKIDDYTVSFKLKEPFAPFLSETSLGIIPKHISLRSYRPVGTTQFKVSSFSTEKVILTNDKIDIVFKLYPTEERALTALKLGEIKAFGGLNNAQLADLKAWRNYNLYTQKLPDRLVAVFFNTRAEAVNEKPVRQALALSTPKEEILKLANKGSEMAAGPLSARNSLQVEQTERFPFDLDKANGLLESAGWKMNNGKRVKDSKALSISLTVSADSEFQEIAKRIGESWQSIGVDFQIITLSNEELSQVIRRTQFQTILTTEEISVDPDQYVLWHSTQVTQGNITALASPKVDKLLEDGRKSNDEEIRKEKYGEFVRILADESPAVFLFYPGYNWLVNKKVGNINITSLNTPAERFDTMGNWQIPRFSI